MNVRSQKKLKRYLMKPAHLQNLKASTEHVCPQCQEPFMGGLNQVYCSDVCKEVKQKDGRAYRTRAEVYKERDYYDTFPVLCSPMPDIGREI